MSILDDARIISDPTSPIEEVIQAAKRSPLHAHKVIDNLGFIVQCMTTGFNAHDIFGDTLALRLFERMSADPEYRNERIVLLMHSNPLGIMGCLRQYPPSAHEFGLLCTRVREIQDETVRALYFGELSTLEHADFEVLRRSGEGDEELAALTADWTEILEQEQADPVALLGRVEREELYENDLLMLARATRHPLIQAALVRHPATFAHVLQARWLQPVVAVGAALFSTAKQAAMARKEAERRGWPVELGALDAPTQAAPALAAGCRVPPTPPSAALSDDDDLWGEA